MGSTHSGRDLFFAKCTIRVARSLCRNFYYNLTFGALWRTAAPPGCPDGVGATTTTLPAPRTRAGSPRKGTSSHVAFFISSADLTIESLADVLHALSAHPLPTYLGGEKQRTCGNGLIWNIAETGLGRTLKVCRGVFASTSIPW